VQIDLQIPTDEEAQNYFLALIQAANIPPENALALKLWLTSTVKLAQSVMSAPPEPEPKPKPKPKTPATVQAYGDLLKDPPA